MPGRRRGGDAQTLRDYWSDHGHAGPSHGAERDAIRWGTPGDFDRCVAQVTEHGNMTPDQAKGYCNLRHHDALGYYPAQHARMEGKGYNPSQQRVGSGMQQGGQFTSTGAGTPAQQAAAGQAAVFAAANAAKPAGQGRRGRRGRGRKKKQSAHQAHVAHQQRQAAQQAARADAAGDRAAVARIRQEISGLRNQIKALQAKLATKSPTTKPGTKTGTKKPAGTAAPTTTTKPTSATTASGKPKKASTSSASAIRAQIASIRAQIAQLQQQEVQAAKSVGGLMIGKVGPEGYVHGWIRVVPGSEQADRQLNELGGLAANHNNEAGGAVDRARSAAEEGRYSAASGHLDNAAFLLHNSGHHRLAEAAEAARDNFADAAEAARRPAAPAGQYRPAPTSSRLEFESAMMMPRGVAPVGSRGGESAVTGPVRTGRKNVRNQRDLPSGRYRTFEGEAREAQRAHAEGRMNDAVELLGSARALAPEGHPRFVLGALQTALARTQHIAVPAIMKVGPKGWSHGWIRGVGGADASKDYDNISKPASSVSSPEQARYEAARVRATGLTEKADRADTERAHEAARNAHHSAAAKAEAAYRAARKSDPATAEEFRKRAVSHGFVEGAHDNYAAKVGGRSVTD